MLDVAEGEKRHTTTTIYERRIDEERAQRQTPKNHRAMRAMLLENTDSH